MIELPSMNKFWETFKIDHQFTGNLSAKFDLQTHSFFSDGKESPEDLLFQASEKELNAISVTDHNTVWGYKKSLFSYAKKLGITLVPGVEIEVAKDIDILVYNSDLDQNFEEFRKDIDDVVKVENKKRLDSASSVIAEIRDYLLKESHKPDWLLWNAKKADEKSEIINHLTLENAEKINLKTGDIDKESKREYVGKPHIAAILGKYKLVDWGIFANTYNVINKNKLLKKSYEVLFTEIAEWPHIETDESMNQKISALNHLKILAHPGKTFMDLGFEYSEANFYEFISKNIIKYNLDGAECFYENYENNTEDFNSLTIQVLKKLSKKLEKTLYGTGGTDSHGSLK